jgi:hypothetical protein
MGAEVVKRWGGKVRWTLLPHMSITLAVTEP